jgi:HEAT repeat protein
MSIADRISVMLAAFAALTEAEEAVLAEEGPDGFEAVQSIEKAFFYASGDSKPASLVREQLLFMLGRMKSRASIMSLFGFLSHEQPDVRCIAGNSLVERAEAQPKEFEDALRAIIERTSTSMDPVHKRLLLEVPGVIAETQNKSLGPMCRKLLKHSDAEVVYSAIEGLRDLDDKEAVADLSRLRRDTRQVNIGDDATPEFHTIGELANEVIDYLQL